MNAIDAAILLGDRLGRERALRPDETDALQAVVRIVKTTRVWTRDKDERLLLAIRKHPRDYANRIAIELNVSTWAVRKRAQKLREMGRG